MLNLSGQGRAVELWQAWRREALRSFVVVTVGLAFLPLTATFVRADCVPETRKVALDKTITVPLKSYRCKIGTGQDIREVRVELDRFSDTAASLITSGGSSALLKKTFGSMSVFENEISKTYRDLLKQFGTTSDVVKQQGEIATRLAITGDRPIAAQDENPNAAPDTIGPAKLRFLDSDEFDYPAASQSASLMKKVIPNDLNYYFSIDSPFCLDESASNFVCKKLGKIPVEMVFWKSLSSGDVANYPKDVQAYNSLLMKVRKNLKEAKEERITPDLPRYFSVMKSVAGDTWPEDLVIATGQHQAVGCGVDADLPGLSGWQFSVAVRAVAMEAMVIENVSSQPLSIGSLFGIRSTTNALRPAKEASSTSEMTAVGSPSQTLPPGKRLLVPMRLVLLSPAELSDDLKKAEKSLADVRTHFGLNGFSGRADALRIPELKDYAFGPSISIGALELNSTRVDLEKVPEPNFVALTITAEAGSCPYLLSRSDGGEEWISYGKILHKAPSRERQYVDTASFKGARMSFRIEEREPEIAHIEDITFNVRLQDGSELALPPRVTRAGRPVSLPLDLVWGAAVDLDFEPPATASSNAILESRISITGYYERYAGIMGEAPWLNEIEASKKSAADSSTAVPKANACFAEARVRLR